MKCPRCSSDQTSLSWLQEHSITYWCRECRSGFDVDRGAVQSTARPEKPQPQAAAPEAEAARA